MPKITSITKASYTNIHLHPRGGANDKIALWGTLHGGNLSLKHNFVHANPAIGAAFDARGARPWPTPTGTTPYTTPHSGPNFHGTLLNIPLSEALDFFGEHGYEFVDTENEAVVERLPRVNRARRRGPDGPAPAVPDMAEVRFGQLLGSLVDIAPPKSWHDAVSELFMSANRFQRIQANTRVQLAGMWPKGVGVYVVRRSAEVSLLESILYIGMTGKLNTDLQPVGQGFAGRMTRYTPYCYTEDDHFKFGPNAAGEELRKLPENQRSQHHYPLGGVLTDCFLLNGTVREISPSLLETIFLQMYASQKRTLPLGNQAF